MNEAERTSRILDRAITLTKQGKLEWEPGGVPAAFLATAGDGVLRIASEDGDDAPPYRFSIIPLTGAGEEIAILRSIEGGGPGATDLNPRLSELYGAVRAAALGIDDVLGSVEEELGL